MKEVLQAEVSKKTMRTSGLLDKLNNQMMRHTQDKAKENCEEASINLEQCQQFAVQYYNTGVKTRHFWFNNLVMQKIFQNTQ